MELKWLIHALRPLKRKMHLYSGLRLLLAFFTIASAASLVVVILSLFIVIPFVRVTLLYILAGAMLAGLAAALFIVPSHRQVMVAADNLGLRERVITAWFLRNESSSVAELQREDTKLALRNVDFRKAYRIKVSNVFYVPALVLLTVAFTLSYVPGRVHHKTQVRESLIQKMQEQERHIEEKLHEQMAKHPELSEEQRKQLQEALQKLKEDFRKAKTEEDTLKALARMENELNQLKMQDSLQDLSNLQNSFFESPLTDTLADALKNEDQKALEEALEQLKQEMEERDKQKEMAELLEKAAQNMGSGSMMTEALQNLSQRAASGNATPSEISKSIGEMLQQNTNNAQGQQAFRQAADEVQKTTGRARRAMSSGGMVAQGEGRQGTPGTSGAGQGNQPGNEPGNEGQGSQGQGDQPGGSAGSQGQGGGGAGAGSGSSSEDAGYNEGDNPGGAGRPPGSRKETEYRQIYVPERLGGEGNETLLHGQRLESGSSTFSEADGAPVQRGAMVPWQEVLSEYREEAVHTMDRQEIPLGMKALVRDYFSSLAPY